MQLMIAITDWLCVILFILGFIGNLLGIVVFSSRRFRCCSTYSILALASFTVNLICIVRYSLLLHSTTRRWLSDGIIGEYWLTCKIFRLTSSARVIAAWITVFWVIERFLYVSSRLNLLFNQRENFQKLEKYKYFAMVIISFIMIILVTGPSLIFYAPYVINVNSTNPIRHCTFDYSQTSTLWKNYFTEYSFGFNHSTGRFLFSEMVPSLLVALFNIGIIICILRTTAHVRRRQEYHHNNQSSMSMVTGTTSKLPVLHIYEPVQQQRRSSIGRSLFKASATPVSSVPFGKMSWMNIVLILHSLLFFLSSSITSIVYYTLSNMWVAAWMSVIILANCSLNFYIYCLSGRQFRTEIKRIAKRFMRNLHKKILRRCCRTHLRRRSSLVHGKELGYHFFPQLADLPVPNQQQRKYENDRTQLDN